MVTGACLVVAGACLVSFPSHPFPPKTFLSFSLYLHIDLCLKAELAFRFPEALELLRSQLTDLGWRNFLFWMFSMVLKACFGLELLQMQLSWQA